MKLSESDILMAVEIASASLSDAGFFDQMAEHLDVNDNEMAMFRDRLWNYLHRGDSRRGARRNPHVEGTNVSKWTLGALIALSAEADQPTKNSATEALKRLRAGLPVATGNYGGFMKYVLTADVDGAYHFADLSNREILRANGLFVSIGKDAWDRPRRRR